MRLARRRFRRATHAFAAGLRLSLGAAALATFACAPTRGSIGVVLAQTPERRLLLREVPPGLAAGRAGLLPGDEVLLIDGRDVRELDERGVHQALAGAVDESVKLTLVRAGRVMRITLRRTPIPPRRG